MAMYTKKQPKSKQKPSELVEAYQLAAKAARTQKKELEAIYREFGVRF